MARSYESSALCLARFIAETIEPGSTLITERLVGLCRGAGPPRADGAHLPTSPDIDDLGDLVTPTTTFRASTGLLLISSDLERERLTAETPDLVLVSCHAAASHTDAGRCVRSIRVPLVIEKWRRHELHHQEPFRLRRGSHTPQRSHASPPRNRTASR